MAREGTRSATGNSKPRVFTNPETGPTIKRTKPATVKKPKTAGAKVGRPAGVAKKSAPGKKPTAATKAKTEVKKVAGAAKAVKAKATPKSKAPVVAK